MRLQKPYHPVGIRTLQLWFFISYKFGHFSFSSDRTMSQPIAHSLIYLNLIWFPTEIYILLVLLPCFFRRNFDRGTEIKATTSWKFITYGIKIGWIILWTEWPFGQRQIRKYNLDPLWFYLSDTVWLRQIYGHLRALYVYSLILKIIFFVLFSILLRQICWERERDISHVFTRADVEQTMLMEISWRRWAELQEQESYKTKMYF